MALSAQVPAAGVQRVMDLHARGEKLLVIRANTANAGSSRRYFVRKASKLMKPIFGQKRKVPRNLTLGGRLGAASGFTADVAAGAGVMM